MSETHDDPAPDQNKTVKVTLELTEELLQEIAAAIPVRFGGQDVRFEGVTGQDLVQKFLVVSIIDLLQSANLQRAGREAERLRQDAMRRTQELTVALTG